MSCADCGLSVVRVAKVTVGQGLIGFPFEPTLQFLVSER